MADKAMTDSESTFSALLKTVKHDKPTIMAAIMPVHDIKARIVPVGNDDQKVLPPSPQQSARIELLKRLYGL
jgi:hypothetical protein